MLTMVSVVTAFASCHKSNGEADKFPQFANIDKIDEGYELALDLENSSSMKKQIISLSRGLKRKDIELVLKRAARKILKENNDMPCKIILYAYREVVSRYKYLDTNEECDAELIFAPYGDLDRSTADVPPEDYRIKIKIKKSYFEKEKEEKEILEKLYRDTKDWEIQLKKIMK